MGGSSFGLALSGGGTRGAAHIGVLKALEEAGLRPSVIAGTSAGAVVAGLYASGMDIRSMEMAGAHLARKGTRYLDPEYGRMAGLMPRLLSGRPMALKGIFKGDRLMEYFCILTGRKHLDEGLCPFVIPAVDLNTGYTVAFTNSHQVKQLDHVRWEWDGYLCQAMMASASVPAVFTPRIMGEYQLVDGGVTDNLPLNLLKACGVSRALAVDLGEVYEGPEKGGIPGVVSHSFSIMRQRLKECGSDEEALFLRPVLGENIGLLTFAAIPEAEAAGYEYTRKRIPKIRKYLEQGILQTEEASL